MLSLDCVELSMCNDVMITSYLQIAMASILMSEAERTFILHGVEENLRSDGRARGDLRPVVIETGVVSHASGSCHLRLANTDILVGVKTEGRVQKFMLGKLVDFSIKWVGGVLLVH